MSNGKIVFTPLTQASLDLGGTYYAQIDNTAFNMDTSDFSLEMLAKATVNNTYLLDKAAAGTLDAKSGWIFRLYYIDNKLLFIINDGNASQLEISSNTNAFTLDSYYYFALTADRDGSAYFYVNGAACGSGAISSRPGSLNNTELFKVGLLWDGPVDFVRVWKGTILTSTWIANQWSWIQAGMPRLAYDATAFWEFNNSLTDSSASAYVLSMSGGSAAYTTGYPTSISSTFMDNFDFGYSEGYAEMETIQRSIDGTLKSYKSANKRRMVLPFKNIGKEQKWALEAAWASGNTVLFYPDAALPAYFTAKIMVPPIFTNDFANYWSGELELEEA